MNKKVWSSGWNIPGYLPDVEPMNFDTYHKAWSALREALEQAAEDYEAGADDPCFNDDPGLDQAHAKMYRDAIRELDGCRAGENLTIRVGDYVWWVQHIRVPEEA